MCKGTTRCSNKKMLKNNKYQLDLYEKIIYKILKTRCNERNY